MFYTWHTTQVASSEALRQIIVIVLYMCLLQVLIEKLTKSVWVLISAQKRTKRDQEAKFTRLTGWSSTQRFDGMCSKAT